MSAKIVKLMKCLRSDQRGLTTVEYVIVLCLIAALAVGTWSTFGEGVEKALAGAALKIGLEVLPAVATD
jgi:Flp pilus assembly pilin Flp